MLQRQLNEEQPGGGAGGGPLPGAGGLTTKGRSALASLRAGTLRAGVASKRGLLGFLGKRGPLPASLIGTAGGGEGGARGGPQDDEDDALAFAAADDGGASGSNKEQQGPGDLFQFYRLLLPSLDDERGRYHLKEALLAKALCKACGRGGPKEDAGAARVLAWQTDSSRASAGSLAHVASDELVRVAAALLVCVFGFELGERGADDERRRRKLELKNPLKKKKKTSVRQRLPLQGRGPTRGAQAGHLRPRPL